MVYDILTNKLIQIKHLIEIYEIEYDKYDDLIEILCFQSIFHRPYSFSIFDDKLTYLTLCMLH